MNLMRNKVVLFTLSLRNQREESVLHEKELVPVTRELVHVMKETVQAMEAQL